MESINQDAQSAVRVWIDKTFNWHIIQTSIKVILSSSGMGTLIIV